MRALAIVIALLGVGAADAATINQSGACSEASFVLDHMTMTDCTINAAYSGNADFTLPVLTVTDGAGNLPLLGTNGVFISMALLVSLNSGLVAQDYEGTITADFTMDPGWEISIVEFTGELSDNGPTAAGGLNFGGICSPPPSNLPEGCRADATSGTFSEVLDAETDAINSGTQSDNVTVGAGDFQFAVTEVTPEPSTLWLALAGLTACLSNRTVRKRRLPESRRSPISLKSCPAKTRLKRTGYRAATTSRGCRSSEISRVRVPAGTREELLLRKDSPASASCAIYFSRPAMRN